VTNSDDLADRLRALEVFATELPTFDVDRAPADPDELFVAWIEDAIDHGVPEPHAMTLSTVDADGRPNARVLILKGIVNGRWRFASSGLSVKGRELAATGVAATTFYWPQRGRQVRVRGPVAPAPPEVSAEDFLQRSPQARAEALRARQGQPRIGPQPPADDRAPGNMVAEHWTVYEIAPEEIEFWQADRDRRHVRLRYTRTGTSWTTQCLWP
jgi:pyridoxamine 5'-phosphate oxidase